MQDEQDVEFEAENNEPRGGSDAEKRVAKLKGELEKCKAERQEYMDGWQRAKADYVNVLKRLDEEKKDEREKGVIKAVEALLPAFDALERAKEHGEAPAGFEAIAKQLESAFAGLGIEAVGRVGELFNPGLHEALGTDETDACEADDSISAVLEQGWRIGGRIIRPAKVRVASYKS